MLDNLRQKLNEKSGLVTGITIVVTIAALALLFLRTGRRPAAEHSMPERAFFSNDDGKTFFVDDALKVPPFDKDGKQAFRCRVYRSAAGKAFVCCLEKYDADSAQQMEDIRAKFPAQLALERYIQFSEKKLLKRPGDKEWVSMDNLERFQKIQVPDNGDGPVDSVSPVFP